jgi:hypothetical protein
LLWFSLVVLGVDSDGIKGQENQCKKDYSAHSRIKF